MKVKENLKTIRRRDIYYILNENGRPRKYKPWLGDMFAFAYDSIMEKSIFPKKFRGNISKHYDILKVAYQDFHNLNILEIATGSGFSAGLISRDNFYTGIDISAGLLRQAVSRFSDRGFIKAEFYVSSADDLPFNDHLFDIVICDLSLNFLGELDRFIIEIKRVMKPGSYFYCSVPVPEKKYPGAGIHGNLYSETELKTAFNNHNFTFNSSPDTNGALLYFRARLNK